MLHKAAPALCASRAPRSPRFPL
ncbi:hypothetical protein PSEUDO8AS_11035 [Pseudomonas sp. 8AS]|nr:hypothetical protein PSEUDO8AS_11035 [Pseudomonas sp. 8AS]